MPETWPEIRRSLPSKPNVGLLLRWSAALAEMDAYYRVPSDLRLCVLRFFEAEVPKILGASSAIRLLPVFPPLFDDSSHRLLESKTTVFGFWIVPPGASRPLGKTELKQLHFDLASDVSNVANEADAQVLAELFHIGQPVDLGQAGYVLRIALGGILITRVATDTTIGATLDARLDWLRDQIHGLRRKIECLVQSHSPLDGSVVSPGATGSASADAALALRSPHTRRAFDLGNG